MGTPPLGSIGIGQLIARIDSSWDTRAEIRAKIERAAAGVEGPGRQTNQLLLALLGESERSQIDQKQTPNPTSLT